MTPESNSRKSPETPILSRAVILLSGGLDSATAGAIARSQGFELYALTVRYGQRHRAELDAAAKVAASMSVAEHRYVDVDLRSLGGASALTSDVAVPKHESVADIGTDIPVTYVPARNTVLLSLALAWSEILEAEDIFVGVNALDYSGYPDCRPEYLQAFQAMARLATKAGVEGGRLTIHAPLVGWTKAQIIRRGLELGVDYGMTVSCYDPDPNGRACGRCDACLLRRRGFMELNARDPARYVN